MFRSKEKVKQALLSGSSVTFANIPVSLEQRFNVILEHAHHFEKHWGSQCFVGMRKHLAWYCRATLRAAELRAQMVQLNNASELMHCLSRYVAFIAAELEPLPSASHEAASRMPSTAIYSPSLSHLSS
jgi:tRNA-dihydrouridine synthase